jgi:hypothetical protein
MVRGARGSIDEILLVHMCRRYIGRWKALAGQTPALHSECLGYIFF